MSGGSWSDSEDWIRFGSFQLSAARRELRQHDRPIDVGQRAIDLLLLLLAEPGKPVSKARLIEAAWEGRAVEGSNLTVQIAALRRRLATKADAASDLHDVIRTVPGFGYVFTAPVSRADEDRPATQPPGQPVLDETRRSQQIAEPLTMFIGRDNDRRTLARLLREHRLVCLTGMGGVGKTRLAMRLSHDLASVFPDGVIFVDLAPLLDPGRVAETVAFATGAGDGRNSAQEAIIAALGDRRILLILDNAEHLIAGVRQVIVAVLARCKQARALVTSRESLGLPGEALFRLSPLELPPESVSPSPTDALHYDAVRLFVDRAQVLLPGFAGNADVMPWIVEICRRLDGIALAIEMAVPRLEVLSVQQLAARLHDRFKAVAPLRHDVEGRQRTLRAMFDWSWDLLTPQQRRMLQILAVFVGGATLGSLEAIAELEDFPTVTGPPEPRELGEIIDQLTALAQKSLIVVGPSEDGEIGPRYRLLETTRQYAFERLDPAQRNHLSRRHALHLAEMFERAEAEWPVTHSATWLVRYEPEADNLRAAMQWAFGNTAETELALRLVAASVLLWWELPGLPLRESRHWYALATARIGGSTPARVQARIWLGRSWVDTLDGDLENYPAADRAVRLFRETADPVGLGAALWRAASTVLCRIHDPSDQVLLDAAVQALEGQPATKWLALCHVRQADLLHFQGSQLQALVAYDRALAIMRDLGYQYGLMVCSGNRSYALFELGRHDDAIAELSALRRELPPGLSRPIGSLLAMVLTAAGRDTEARQAVDESLTDLMRVGLPATLARTLEAHAKLIAQHGDHERAAWLLGFVLTVHPHDRTRFGPRRLVYDRLVALLGSALPAQDLQRFLAQGAAATEKEAITTAISGSAVMTTPRSLSTGGASL